MTICLENTYHPQNASALVRNCEAFGIQDIHTVETVCRFTPNANIVRGTDKWVDIRKHPDTPSLVGDLRARGYRIVATSPHADDRTPETFDVEAGPFALFFGTEHAGISEEVVAGGRRVRPHSDVRFRREPERVGLGGHPALPALVAVEGERRAVAHFGDRARRNPAALDALDRARFRTHSPAGRILDRLSVARAPLSIWGGSGSGRSLEALRVRSVSLVPRSRTFSDRKARRYLRPGIVPWLPVAGIPARCSRGPVAVACRSPFPVAGHASCKRF